MRTAFTDLNYLASAAQAPAARAQRRWEEMV